MWGHELNSRSESDKVSVKGKMEAVTYNQTQVGVPYFRWTNVGMHRTSSVAVCPDIRIRPDTKKPDIQDFKIVISQWRIKT